MLAISFEKGCTMTMLYFPAGHQPRYDNFTVDGILDETLREGSERCPFSVTTQHKMPLIRSIIRTGIKDLVFGSSPQDPADIADVLSELLKNGELPPDLKFSFIMLLNCHEPLMERFVNFPQELKRYVTISFGMVSHKANERLFEKATETLRRYGFSSFRVSLLNNFNTGIDEQTYSRITKDIDRSLAIDIDVIRINDSLGTIYPEAMAILAANLRHDYPYVNFCLHAHDDRGIGLQNALVSIYNGFNLIEGGFANAGNRSGLPAIELLDLIFREKGITLKSGTLNHQAVIDTARLAEKTFLIVPDLYRAVSGLLVERENMGVANIPSFLGADRQVPYFLNRIGLHDATIQTIMRDGGFMKEANDPTSVAKVKSYIEKIMLETTKRKKSQFDRIYNEIEDFYYSETMLSEIAASHVRSVFS